MKTFERCFETYTQAFDSRTDFRMEYRLRRSDGEYRWVLDIGVPRFNQDRLVCRLHRHLYRCHRTEAGGRGARKREPQVD